MTDSHPECERLDQLPNNVRFNTKLKSSEWKKYVDALGTNEAGRLYFDQIALSPIILEPLQNT